MQNLAHNFAVVFEQALFFTGLLYLVSWMGGRKLTNSEVLFLFGMGFLLSLLSPIVPTYVFWIVLTTPWLLRLLRRTLNTKPASQVKILLARKPSELPEKSEL